MADEDLTKKYKTVEVEITAVDTPVAGPPGKRSGWGAKAGTLTVAGKVVEIVVKRPDADNGFGGSEFGLRILEDGSVILTSYGSHLTFEHCERNLRLKNERPWKVTKKRKEKRGGTGKDV